MGTSFVRPDIQLLADYANNERLLRLHVDVPLSFENYHRLQMLMNDGKAAEALSLIKSLNPEGAAFLDLFFRADLVKENPAT